MKRALLVLYMFVLGVLLAPGVVQAAEKADTVAVAVVGEYRISGPYTHKNLSVFVVHGKDKLAGKRFITLDDALKQKKAVVHETGNVQKLSVENTSKTVYVYIQSGVIVKGGKQDRTIRYDMVVPPQSGKMAIGAFCVEAGRWTGRGNESVAKFDSAASVLSTKELKLAAKHKGSQREVWEKVAKAQTDLSVSLGRSVRALQSASSLQLTLENKKLNRAAGEYAAALSKAFAGKTDVVGYAFAINGKINSADVYASGQLFRILLPGLLRASAVEAIAGLKKGQTFTAPTVEAVKKLFLDAQGGKKSEKDLTNGAKMIIKESDKSILFQVVDPKMRNAAVRIEILSK